MFGQILRQVGRAAAIYFSDVLLWLSVAGAIEVIAVVGAAALCILTAGYFFESMKKNPLVLVLGGIVALTGTFLMFREVRGLIWTPPQVVAAPVPAPAPAPPVNPPAPYPSFEIVCSSVYLKASCEAVSTCFWFSNKCQKKLVNLPSPPPTVPPASVQPPISLGGCSGLPPATCSAMPGCYWGLITNKCEKKIALIPPSPPVILPVTSCSFLSKSECAVNFLCYWSSLFNRCEKLQFGAGLTATDPPPVAPSCLGLNEFQCKFRAGCTWLLGTCLKQYQPK